MLHIAYRQGRDASNGRTLLQGATVYGGPPGSAARAMLERVVPAVGLSNKDFSFVANLDSQPDVIVVFAPISPERIGQLAGYELFSLGTPQMVGKGSVVDGVALMFPQLRPFIIPEGFYGAITREPIVTVAVDTVLVSSDKLNPAVAYDLVERLLAVRASVAAQRPGLFRSLSEDFDPGSLTFAIHEGTRAYQTRNTPTIYERLAGVVEAALTLLVAVLSGSFAVVRFIKVRRKNRIDQFYKDVLEVRRVAQEPLTVDERQALDEKLRRLEADAFEQLIDERLAADESFRIFIALLGEVRQELAAPV